jgi:hypothetical protein
MWRRRKFVTTSDNRRCGPNTLYSTKSSRIQLGLQEVYLLAENSAIVQNKVHHKLDQNHTEQLRHLEEISASIADFRIQENTANIPCHVNYSSPHQFVPGSGHEVDVSPSNSIKAFHHNGAILFDSKQMTAISAVGIRTAQFPRVACKPWCSCICHTERSFRSPSFMEKLVGSLFIGYSGVPILRQKCNQHSCHLESQPLMYVTYYFPTWFLARMVSLMISTTPLAGPVVSLKTQRTVSGDADIFTCAKTGDINKMKYLFQNGLASPHDVSFSSGITALHVCVTCYGSTLNMLSISQFAISYQHIDMCKLLLQANADPFLENRTRW